MGRPNIKIWALSILLNAIWAMDTSSGWRLESVEPNIIRDGDWINLYVSDSYSKVKYRGQGLEFNVSEWFNLKCNTWFHYEAYNVPQFKSILNFMKMCRTVSPHFQTSHRTVRRIVYKLQYVLRLYIKQ